MDKNNNDFDIDLFGDAYKDLNKPEPKMIEFDEPVEVKIDSIKDERFHGDDDDSEDIAENKKMGMYVALGAILLLIACFGIIKAVTANKMVELSSEGMKSVSDWNKFKDNCSYNKKDKIIVKILDKDEIKSEKDLVYDGKNYSYGEDGKKYKYMLDVKGKLEDFGSDIRLIVLANEKYTFEEIFESMADNNEEYLANIDIQQVKDGVKAFADTLDSLDKTIDGKDTNQEDKDSNSSKNKKNIEYQLIYCY